MDLEALQRRSMDEDGDADADADAAAGGGASGGAGAAPSTLSAQRAPASASAAAPRDRVALAAARFESLSASLKAGGEANTCPCGGTHVDSAARLRGVTVTKVKSAKALTKVSYVLS